MTQEVHFIPLANISESPFNHRTNFPEAELRELADSIQDVGVMQPIVVRLLPESQAELYFRYEAIFGHRRLRASALAGQERIPALVVEKTDQEVAIMQLHENMKRTNPSAIEEADGFLHLVKVHKMKADAIAEAVGKSRSYVYARLKLARSAPEVRKACAEQGLSAETAQEIAANVPHHDQQRAALKQVRNKFQETTERPIVWHSVREARVILDRAFKATLSSATFDIYDENLLGRVGACPQCPHRAGQHPDLTHLAADTCLDRHCFDSKETAHHANRAKAVADQGHTTITGDAAEKLMPNAWSRPPGMQPTTTVAYTTKASLDGSEVKVSFDEIMHKLGDAAPRITYVLNPHTKVLQGFVTEDQQRDLLKAEGQYEVPDADDGDEDSASGGSSTSTGDRKDPLDDWSEAERATTDAAAWIRVRRAVARRIIETPRSVEELRALVMNELDRNYDLGLVGDLLGLAEQADAYGDEDTWYRDWVSKAPADHLSAILVGLEIDEQLGPRLHVFGSRVEEAHAKAQKLVAIAASYGVDVATVIAPEKAEEPGATDQVQVDAFSEGAATASTEPPKPATPTSRAPYKYRNKLTGETWSGRGLQPKWLKVAIADGKRLEDFHVAATPAAAETEAAA